MGLVDYQTPLVLAARSESESARFGHPTDRLTVGFEAASSVSPSELIQTVQDALDGSDATTVILRFPAELLSIVRELRLGERVGYSGGSIVYWEAVPRPFTSQSASGAEAVPSERERLRSEILSVLEDSFEGYINHYTANPLLPRSAVVAGYSEWAQDSMTNPANRVFVVRVSNTIIGVAVVRVTPGLWEVELASISPAAQRQGHYLTLMSHVLSAAHAETIARVVISTQSHNIGVQRAWVKLGFLPIASIETVHLIDAGVVGQSRP